MMDPDARNSLSDTELDKLVSVVDELVPLALMHHTSLPKQRIRFGIKPDGSRVTLLDKSIEATWRTVIEKRCPGHAIFGEEYGGDFRSRNYCWHLDPVDGTDDLTRGIPLHAYIIALTLNGRPVVAAIGHPALNVELRATFGRGAWVNGQRATACKADPFEDHAIAIPAMEDFLRGADASNVLLDLEKRFPNYRVFRNAYGHTAVVVGSLDAAVEFDVAPWDILATRLLIEEAGGSFRQFRQVTERDGVIKHGVTFGREPVVMEICRVMSFHGWECRSIADIPTGIE